MAGNRRGYAALPDSDRLRDHAELKEHALAHLDHYLEQLEASMLRLGGHVHWAADAEEAAGRVATPRWPAQAAVKSKSMTTERSPQSPRSRPPASRSWRRDFGEYIIGSPANAPHRVAPAVHHTRESIAARPVEPPGRAT